MVRQGVELARTACSVITSSPNRADAFSPDFLHHLFHHFHLPLPSLYLPQNRGGVLTASCGGRGSEDLGGFGLDGEWEPMLWVAHHGK